MYYIQDYFYVVFVLHVSILISVNLFRVTPPVVWAQRNDCLWVTICVEDIVNEKLDLKSNSLSFRYVKFNIDIFLEM